MKNTLLLAGFSGVILFANPSPADAQNPPRRDYSIPVLDLNDLPEFHTVVARDIDNPNQYLGHPSTVLLDDGRSILTAFPTAHGRGKLRMRLSRDGGLNWGAVETPDIDLHEVPTLFKKHFAIDERIEHMV